MQHSNVEHSLMHYNAYSSSLVIQYDFGADDVRNLGCTFVNLSKLYVCMNIANTLKIQPFELRIRLVWCVQSLFLGAINPISFDLELYI